MRLMFQDPGFVTSVAEDLDAKLFESKIDRWIGGTILTLKKQGHVATKASLINELRKSAKLGTVKQSDVSLVMKVVGMLGDPLKDRSYVAQEVHHFIHHQKVLDTLFTSADLMEKHDFQAVLKKMRSAVDYDPTPQSRAGTRLVTDIAERLKRRRSFEKNGIPTGTPLDNYLVHGGLPPKAIGIILGTAGRGKTAVLCHIGKSAVINKPLSVAHYTLEVSEEGTCDRYDAAFSKVPLTELKDREKEVAAAYKQLGQSIGDCLMVKEFPTRSLTVNGIKAHLKRLESEAFYPGMLIVDYAGLMRSSDRYTDRYTELGAIVEELRGLAVELNIPIWTALQANRAAVSKERVTTEDLAESFQPAMVADLIVAICQSDKEKAAKKARFYIAKNRFGVDSIEIAIKLDTAAVSVRAI